MAHRIIGVDLGKASVTLAVLEVGLRRTRVVSVHEARVPPGEEPHLERAARAAGAVVRQLGLEHAIDYAAFPGEVFVRNLEFAFANLQRADLERVVSTELEAQLPRDIDELATDVELLPAEPPAPGRPAATRVLAVAAPRAEVTAAHAALARAGVEVHGMLAPATAYGRLVDSLGESGAVLVVDVGAAHTHACLVRRGRPLFARTLLRGGEQLTRALGEAWRLEGPAAEEAKRKDGFVASAVYPAPSPGWAQVSSVVERELQPLCRDLQAMLAAARRTVGVTAERVLLAGGGARLRGLGPHLAEQLGLPVVGIGEAVERGLGVAPGLGADAAALAIAVALEGASGRPRLDLGKGSGGGVRPFSFLRQKAASFATAALVLVALLAGNAYARLYTLRREEALLEERLRVETLAAFGEAKTLEELQAKLEPAKKEDSPLPKVTAFDLLITISKQLPPRDRLKIDVLSLDIEPKKITLRAIVENAAAIDEVEKGLRTVDCFTEIQRGKVDVVNEGKQVTLTVTSKCM